MERYTIVQLKEELESRGLNTSGSKSDLLIRLQEVLMNEKTTEQQSKVEDVHVNPEDSVSGVSHWGSSTSGSSGRNSIVHLTAVEAADQAALKASHLVHTQQLENEERMLRQEKEMLEIKAKLQEAEARKKVLTNILERYSDSEVSTRSKPKSQGLNSNAEMYYPPTGANDLRDTFLEDNQSVISKVSQDGNVLQAPVSQPAPPQFGVQPQFNVNTVHPNSGLAQTQLMDTLIAYNLKVLMP